MPCKVINHEFLFRVVLKELHIFEEIVDRSENGFFMTQEQIGGRKVLLRIRVHVLDGGAARRPGQNSHACLLQQHEVLSEIFAFSKLPLVLANFVNLQSSKAV